MSVLLTGQNSESVSDECICSLVELGGFNTEKVIDYIQSEFEDEQGKAHYLLEKLKNSSLAQAICSVPLNCAMVCYFQRHVSPDHLPNTMTDLFTSVISHVVISSASKHQPQYQYIANISSLSEDLQKLWWRLCEFALHAMLIHQVVFSYQNLVEFFTQDSAEKVLCFGAVSYTHLTLPTIYSV